MLVPATGLSVALLLYVAIAPAYALLQRRYSERGRRAAPPLSEASRWLPDVDVIVPCYNEEPGLLADCLRSLRAQDYPGRTRVWVVDDGSENRDRLQPVFDAVTEPAWRVVLLAGNRGKREAQAAALVEGDGEVVLTIDSDTTIEADGISRIVARLRDPEIGAVAGDLQPSNLGATWLTRLIATRYELLFRRERAAQSVFGAVLCCAGPFSAYRRAAMEAVWASYMSRRRWGRRRVFGDDLELTNLVLADGWRSVYEASAKASTSVPATLARFVRQQVRWNRSFYRELPRMLRLLPGRSRYLALDLAARTLLPMLLGLALVVTAVDAVVTPARLLTDISALGLMALASVNLVPSLSDAGSRRFALGYGLIFVGLLLPTRLWAACTLRQNRWGTRDLPRHPAAPAGARTGWPMGDHGGAAVTEPST
jgi:N-acetylglucosaminyltransferase